MNETNLDSKTVEGFGEEWSRFDQTGMTEKEYQEQFERYFDIFPWESLPSSAVGFDMGCGSGRWAKKVALKVGKLYCIDASSAALEIARKNLSSLDNVSFLENSVENIEISDDSMDFGYSLGVLHHVPDTLDGIKACTNKLKTGAPFLIYLYYAFDNRPFWFRAIWKASDLLRGLISSLPFAVKKLVTDVIAALVYFPLAKLSLLLEKLNFNVDVLPLSSYRYHSFYTMRTDSLDRFGTRLEHRFTKAQIFDMLSEAGLEKIEFSTTIPYWCAIGYKK